MKNKMAIVLVLAMLAGLLGGCSAFEEDPSKQYGEYVQSMFDVEYKGELDKYLELTEDTREEAEQYYDTCMSYWAYGLADYFYIVLVNEEMENRLTDLTKQIFSHVKYEVADAQKSGDYYTVEVTVYPMEFTDLVYDEVVAYANDFQARSDAGEYGDYENDQAASDAREIEYGNAVMDILEGYVDQISYADPVHKIVKITEDDDGYYGFSDEDYADIEDYFLY